MKKRFFAVALAGAAVLALASCGDKQQDAKIEVVDENGTTTEVAVSETDDKEEVAQALETCLNAKPSEEELKKIAGVTVTASAAVSANFGTDSKDKIDYKASAKAAVVFGETYGVDASASLTGTVTGTDDYATALQAMLPTASAEVFSVDHKVYASASYKVGNAADAESDDYKYMLDVDQFIADAQADGAEIDFDDEEVKAQIAEYETEIKEYVAEGLEEFGYTEEDVEKWVNDGYLKVTSEAHQALVDFVEMFNVKISDTSKNTITFETSFSPEAIEAMEDGTTTTVAASDMVTASITLSTVTMLPTAVHADFSSMVGELLAEMALSKITDTSSLVGQAAVKLFNDSIKNTSGSADVTIAYSATLGKHSVNDADYTAITYAGTKDFVGGIFNTIASGVAGGLIDGLLTE